LVIYGSKTGNHHINRHINFVVLNWTFSYQWSSYFGNNVCIHVRNIAANKYSQVTVLYCTCQCRDTSTISFTTDLCNPPPRRIVNNSYLFNEMRPKDPFSFLENKFRDTSDGRLAVQLFCNAVSIM
jgi:hypothetical protein